MTISEFCKNYNKLATDGLKEKYLKENIHIKKYVSFITKVTLADKLAISTTIDSETGNINLKSDVNYLLFVRILIEQYTNLEIEKDGFYDEYDLLNESGLLDKIMQMIPEKEISEFKAICDMKKDDLLFNQSTPKAFISQQIDKITTAASTTLKPALEKISELLENMDEKDIDKISKVLERGLKRIK